MNHTAAGALPANPPFPRQRPAANRTPRRGLPTGPRQATARQRSAITPLTAPTDEYVSDYAELVTALSHAVIGIPYTIEFIDDITVPSGSTISPLYDTEVVLTGDYRLIGADGQPAIVVPETATLTLDGITVTHTPGELGPGVTNFGTLTLLTGAVSGNTNDNGGGVVNEAVFAPAIFTMSGGEISGNTAINPAIGPAYGGGVYNVSPTYPTSSATFNMTGGLISENTAIGTGPGPGGGGVGGGVFNGASSNFTMSGSAVISENMTTGAGAGVINYSGSFTMSGNAVISGNTAGDGSPGSGGGGGVGNGPGAGGSGSFTMSGSAVIFGNTTTTGGGGGVSNNGTFFMSDSALITENTASRGGGVYSTNHFEITGGEISYNTATGPIGNGGGGGMYAFDRASGTMTDAVILGNTASINGGGICTGQYIGGWNFPIIDTCVISDNTSQTGNGGGIYAHLSAWPDITGATLITGNTAPLGDGGAIWIDYTYLNRLTVGEDVVFADNRASEGFFMTDPADILLHDTNILTTDFTYPFTYGYNNFDISYTFGEPYDDTIVFTGTKEATGAQLAAGLFEFGLFNDLGELVETTTNDGFGNIIFPPLVFDAVGTYNFTIRELTEDENGWVTDPTVFPAVVTVLLIDGEISITVDYPNGEPLFTDSFEPEECGLIEFPPLTFTAPGVYEFTFRELTPSGDGWTTDGRDYRVIVTVTEQNGVLVATLEYPDGFPVFENRYEPTQVSVIISGTKVAIGADLICGMFEFGLFDDEGNLVATTVNGPA